MSRGLKIFAGVMVFFGVISLVFLLTAKNKSQKVSNQPTAQVATQPTDKTAAQKAAQSKTNQIANQAKLEANKALIRSQWQQCKAKTTASANTNLFWNVKISEGIPAGGTYAKGILDSDTAFPVRVTIKSDSQFTDKIKQILIVGKIAKLRGTCIDFASDGSVVLQAF